MRILSGIHFATGRSVRATIRTTWNVAVTYASRNIPNLGDDSRGFRLTIDVGKGAFVFYLDFQFMRVGHIDADVITSVDGAQQDQLDTLPKLVEAKLRAAEATLPK